MALEDEIRLLRDRSVTDLNVAHDYYTDAKIAWRVLLEAVASGRTFKFRKTITGSITTQIDLTTKARGYIAEQLAEATFQQFIAIFEGYFFDLLRIWLMAYPRNLSGRKVDFKSVLDAPDKNS